jgi:hypothetical protein
MVDLAPINAEAGDAEVDANARANETGVCPSCEQAIPPHGKGLLARADQV